MLACVYAIAKGVNEEGYCEPEPEISNRGQELPEDFEDGKFNLIL
jgi:hypothetical protein